MAIWHLLIFGFINGPIFPATGYKYTLHRANVPLTRAKINKVFQVSTEKSRVVPLTSV
jgi:hypothetical protein